MSLYEKNFGQRLCHLQRWAITREPEFFLTCGFRRMLDNHPLLLQREIRKIVRADFDSERVSFWPFLAKFEFSRKIGLRHF